MQNTENTRIITVEDVNKLLQYLQDAYGAVGRDILIGDGEGAGVQDITEAVLNTVSSGVIERWAAEYFPEDFRGVHPDDLEGYPNEDDYADELADFGFERRKA